MEGRRQRQSQELLQQQVVALSDENLSRIFELIESSQERATLSLVCRQWHRVDGNTRKNISIANMYAVAPTALTRRFKCLEGIKLKGKPLPRLAEYDLLLPQWGGCAYPWLKELATTYEHLKTLQLRRVEVRNADLYLLAAAPFNATLQVLHLHKCSGFTTSGLVPLSRTCRSLRVLSLEDSDVFDEGGEWLHALAQNNSVLESLDFAVPGLDTASVKDLAFLVGRCKSLVSLKVGDIDMSDLAGVLSKVPFLKELGTGHFGDLGDENKGMAASINLPQHLTSLSGLWAMPDLGLHMVQPVAENLKKLDLKFTVLSRRGHCELLSHCFALEELQARNVLGDEGLQVLGKTCKKLRRLRVENDDAGYISHSGVVAVAQGCAELRHLTLYICDITNAALAMVGQGCLHLTDFRMVLVSKVQLVADLPLDDGVKLLLKGCVNLIRFSLYLRRRGLTDQGLAYIGKYGQKLKWLLIGCTGESDVGLASVAHGCQQLERLEIRDCPFSEAGFVTALVAMNSLKYLWVQGHGAIEIAVEGCAHGDLDNIYATLQYLEHTNNIKIELLICCGDFQAVRNEDDLESLSCPPKYRAMNSFWKYYSGVEIAPFPTLFVGGNHEASNYLWELYYGGFVAPNIYFLGFAGVVQFGGIRIGGLSGIYKDHDFHKGHFEHAPYNKDNIKSVYNVRQYDVLKLMEVRGAIDIFVSHDWPRGITKYGDAQQLLRQKPHFQQDIETNQLGSKAGEQLLHALKPLYWFSAHLHTKFSALVPHPGHHHPTKFLALDKCLPRRNFLQVIDIPGGAGPLEFRYDEEWLAITRAYHFLLPLHETPAQIGMQAVDLMAHRHWVEKRLAEKGYVIPTEFYMTAPAYSPNSARHRGGHMRNPQTEEFLRLLELPYLLDCKTAPPIPLDSQEYMASLPKVLQTEGLVTGDPNEIPLEDDKDDSQDMLDDVNGLEESSGLEFDDPNEIVLEDEDNEQYHST